MKRTFSFAVVWVLTAQAAYSQTGSNEREVSDKMQVTQNVPTLRIDPAKAYGGTVSDYFEQVDYIPLETTKESLFGYIFDLVVTDSSYVIKDLDTRSVLFFSTDGRFITKVKDSRSFIMHNKVKNQIGFLQYSPGHSKDSYKITIDYYTLRGKKLTTLDVDFNVGNSTVNDYFLTPVTDNYYLNCNSCSVVRSKVDRDSTKPCYYLSIYKGDSIYKQFLPATGKYSMAINHLQAGIERPDVIQNGTFYVSTPLEHSIYKVNKESATKLYQVVFPADRVLSSAILKSRDTKFLDSLQQSLMMSRTLITSLKNIFFVGQKLFFKIQTPSRVIASNTSLNEYQYNFVYDTGSHKLVSLDRITPDAASYFLPFMGEGSKGKGLASNNQYVFGFISSLALFAAHDAAKSNSVEYPAELRRFFETQTRKSNPVIIRMKPKG